MELSDQEKMILEDRLKAEYLCMSKYKLYADQASDPQIKNVFSIVSDQEAQHVEILRSLLEQGGFSPPEPLS
ncbi:MAG: ferritin-like domain-containing protein [Clostridiales bacterium]|nr:ferritin-like domain-containing protein [Clostridiales bacterium]